MQALIICAPQFWSLLRNSLGRGDFLADPFRVSFSVITAVVCPSCSLFSIAHKYRETRTAFFNSA